MKTVKDSFFTSVKNFFLYGQRREIDPSVFNDPLALQTEWIPLQPKGTNFKTHTLKAISGNRLEFRATIGLFLFFGFVVFMGSLALIVGALLTFNLVEVNSDTDSTRSLVGLGFMIGGAFFLYLGTTQIIKSNMPLVFDKRKGYFWKGREMPDLLLGKDGGKHLLTPLEKIHAIQILSEFVGGKSSFYSYEINLVLKDGSRIPLIDHHGKRTVCNDAEKLGRFIGVPVWSAV